MNNFNSRQNRKGRGFGRSAGYRTQAPSQRNYSSGPGGNQRGRQHLFTRLIASREMRIYSFNDAQRFIQEMVRFDSKVDLLAKLDDDRMFGKERIRESLSCIKSNEDIEHILVPFLQVILNEETCQPLYEPLRNRVLMIIFQIPCLLEGLVNLKTISLSSKATATIICMFLVALAKPFMEARQSASLRSLAVALDDRGDIPQAEVLCAILLIREANALDISSIAGTSDANIAKDRYSTVCWVTDRVPPGGRHSNDQINYRDIQLVPTIDELLCEKNPWLPLHNESNKYIENPESRLLDSNFRLLRADAVCTMKERINEQTHLWKNSRIVGLSCHQKDLSPLSFIIQLDENNNVGKATDWRNNARILPQNSIIALCHNGIPIRLGTIIVGECKKNGEWLLSPGGAKIGVSFYSQTDFNTSIEEIGKNAPLNEKINNLKKSTKGKKKMYFTQEHYREQMVCYDLVEVSQSFFSYEPILKTLQEMDSVPLANKIVLINSQSERPLYLPPVVRMPRVKPFNGFSCNLNNWSTKDVTANTSLDESQANALWHCLTHRVALVQGPPGTGKTFMGALVAQMILRNTNQSILCVCFTNHALDQFLEHLLDAGEQKIVRLGGRSKSEKLEGYQLSNLAKAKTNLNPKALKRLKQVEAQMYSSLETIQDLVKLNEQSLGWQRPQGGVEHYLQVYHQDIVKQLSIPEVEADGFTQVGSDGKPIEDDFLWKLWLKGGTCPSWLNFDTMPYFQEVWGLDKEMRYKLVDTWRQEIMSDVRNDLFQATEQYEKLRLERQSLRRAKDLQILNDAKVIGATTNGAAQFRDILKAKKPGVVIVEEAGEVFESHILSALSSDVSHLILIGDHKQLRPKAETYKLTTVSGNGYNLDCSMFERLVLAGLPAAMLDVQHRMRPSISQIVRCQTYPSLKDHPSVEKHPDVLGVKSNVVFINHDEKEDGQNDKRRWNNDYTKTKSNMYEAKLCVELVRFFLLQGYDSEQLVVLTPYVGQLVKIAKTMEKELTDTKGYISDMDLKEVDDDALESFTNKDNCKSESKNVRCATVDNFQGEEADIVIISLVRSNEEGKVGFLKEAQRVNVLMSRARYGLFVIGNKETFLSNNGNHVWKIILGMMDVRKGLPTFCQLHPNDETVELSEVEEFRKHRPNGGCCRPCNYRMSCGHACPQCCHPIDRQHQAAQKRCCEPCRKFPPECTLQHPCPKLCKDECGPCTAIVVGPTELPCGHLVHNSLCHDVRNPSAIKILSTKCNEKVSFKFEGCGHVVETKCFNTRLEFPLCPALCNHPLKCGHLCSNRCGCSDEAHRCLKSCERKLFCGHICGSSCHDGNCGPCKRCCEVKCIHSKCPNDCCHPCAPCVHECQWRCEHQGRCLLVCSAPCSRLPCNKRCSKLLTCGHQCPTVCGEVCPNQDYCQICGSESNKSHVVDMIEFSTYQEHNLDSDPVVILPCSHFYSISTMDQSFQMESAYQKRGDDFIKTQTLFAGHIDPKPRSCPDCRAVIHSVFRYGRVINFAELNSLERKHSMEIKNTLEKYASFLESTKIVALEELVEMVKKGPMHCVFEACAGSAQVEVREPPVKLLITAMKLLAEKHANEAKKAGDKNYKKSCVILRSCIEICNDTKSHRSGCEVRLMLASILLKFSSLVMTEGVKAEKDEILNWIINHEVDFKDLKKQALELKQKDLAAERAAVIKAMHVVEGYDYGGSWSSHWYECPNGHLYFIGECGGAMAESKCIECGAPVGGSSHLLLATNRPARSEALL